MMQHGWFSEITCPQPNNVVNGVVAVPTVTFGSTYTVTCDSGYELTGSSSRQCIESGYWDGQEPYCQGKLMILSIK